MTKKLLKVVGITSVAILSVSLSSHVLAMAPFQASYQFSYNNKNLGSATRTLSQQGNAGAAVASFGGFGSGGGGGSSGGGGGGGGGGRSRLHHKRRPGHRRNTQHSVATVEPICDMRKVVNGVVTVDQDKLNKLVQTDPIDLHYAVEEEPFARLVNQIPF